MRRSEGGTGPGGCSARGGERRGILRAAAAAARSLRCLAASSSADEVALELASVGKTEVDANGFGTAKVEGLETGGLVGVGGELRVGCMRAATGVLSTDDPVADGCLDGMRCCCKASVQPGAGDQGARPASVPLGGKGVLKRTSGFVSLAAALGTAGLAARLMVCGVLIRGTAPGCGGAAAGPPARALSTLNS